VYERVEGAGIGWFREVDAAAVPRPLERGTSRAPGLEPAAVLLLLTRLAHADVQ
jgi:hypothetical protein